MATGGDTHQSNGLYSTLHQDRDQHHYEGLVNAGKADGKQQPLPNTASPVYIEPIDASNSAKSYKANQDRPPDYAIASSPTIPQRPLHSNSREAFDYQHIGGDNYNSGTPAVCPLGPALEYASEGMSVACNTKPSLKQLTGMQNYHNENHLNKYHSTDSMYYNDYCNPQHPPPSVRYINKPGMENVDWVDYSQKSQYENETYEEIPADEGRPSSSCSMRSTSSIKPILPLERSNVSVMNRHGKRIIWLIGIVIALLVLVAVLVGIGVFLSRKGSSDQGSSDQGKATPRTDISSTSPPNNGGHTPGNGGNSPTTSTGNPPGNTGNFPSTSGNSPTEPRVVTTTTSPPTATTKPPLIPNHTYFTSSLVMVDHPRDKARLTGDSCTLCCLATGFPSPVYYDWYKDGALLATHRQYSNTSSVLYLSVLAASDSGDYSCRASNAHSSVFSDTAWIQVRETEFLCQTTPHEYPVALPTDCTYDGDTTYNRGYCPTTPCRGPTAPNGEHCVDSVQYCCGPASYATIVITCRGQPYEISIIQECGCIPCDKPLHTIVGIAQTLDGSSKFSYGHIYLRNMSTPINDRFGTMGIFELQLENNAHRLVLLTDNVYDQGAFYNRSSHVMNLPNTLTGSQYLSADVRYVIKSSERLMTSAEINKEFTRKDGTPFLSLKIEGNHFVIEDNVPFHGEVDISINFISGDDIEGLQAVAGDFMFVGGNGKPHHLMAYGLFVIELVGNDSTISYNQDIQVSVLGEQIGNISQTRLWRLGESGYWHVENGLTSIGENGASGNEYETTIMGLPRGTTWFSIAKAVEWATCFTKVRLFTSDSIILGSQLTGATVKVTILDGEGSGMVSGARATSDRNDLNGYCIAHPCDETETFRLHTTASYEGELLNDTNTERSSDNNVGINVSSSQGPTYTSAEVCSTADIASHRYIAFKRETCVTDLNTVGQPLSFNTDGCQALTYQAWHSAQEQVSKLFKSCHIKVVAPGASGAIFQSVSLSSEEQGSVELFGIREDCINSKGVVCLQIKPGGSKNCNAKPDNEIVGDTNITIHSLSNHLAISDIDASLSSQFTVASTVGDSVLNFRFPGDTYGHFYGIYCANDASPESARWRSKRYCLSGKERDTEITASNEISQDRYAVKFE